MRDYEPAIGLVVLERVGPVRLTQQMGHRDYSVWIRGRVTAQGGEALMRQVFNRLAGAWRVMTGVSA